MKSEIIYYTGLILGKRFRRWYYFHCAESNSDGTKNYPWLWGLLRLVKEIRSSNGCTIGYS